jgi:RNA polymerase sigma-70 factor (ECF subfamily)
VSGAAVAGLGTRLHDGDENALVDCYRSYGPAIRSYLRPMLAPADVDDVLQLAFLDLWRSRERFDPSRPIEPWLFTIARRRAISHLRASSGVVDVSTVRDLVGEDGDRLAERFAWAAEVRRAVGQLSPEQREAIRLVFYDQLSHREAAEQLDVPLGTVKARVWRGLRALARQLEGPDE